MKRSHDLGSWAPFLFGDPVYFMPPIFQSASPISDVPHRLGADRALLRQTLHTARMILVRLYIRFKPAGASLQVPSRFALAVRSNLTQIHRGFIAAC